MSSHERGARIGAIESLYRRRFTDFMRFAGVLLGDEERARDAVQEAFAKAVRRRSSFRAEGELEAWIWRVVVNTVRDQRRSRDRASKRERGVTESSWNGGYPSFQQESIRAQIALLPERQRLVLFLRYYADLDYAAIGRALSIKPGTVAATLSAAHESLRRTGEEVIR